MPSDDDSDLEYYDWDDVDPDEAEAVELPIADAVDDSLEALLPDGSGLALSGTGAGREHTAVPSVDARDDLTLIALRSRDECLDASSPVVLYHRPFRAADQVPRLLASVVAETRGRVALGVITPLPNLNAQSNRDWLDGCGAAGVRITDPRCYKLDGSMGQDAISQRASNTWPTITADPVAVADLLDAQRQAGANLLLTSGRALDVADAANSLAAACVEGDQALASLESGERLALNLTMGHEWLTSAAARNELLDQLLDQEQFDVWYVRVLWPNDPAAPHQPTQLQMLQGYKQLAQLASDEERVLLLPQTGLTGWLQLAFGAAGFGTGQSFTDQGFHRARGGGGGAPPVERYFEPTILHVVERPAHDVLRQMNGYIPCDCPYCPALHANPIWNHQLSALHHAHWAGRLSDPGSRPSGAIRRRVRRALREASQLQLAGANEPRHLAVWDQVL
jgi:hypothetical protein